VLDVTAAVLCGGLGTRLRSKVGGLPKVLAEVGGRPFLTYVLDAVADAGVRRVVLCTGYGAAEVEKALGCTYRGVEIAYSPEAVPMGTGGALRASAERITTDLVLAMNGDSLCDADLVSFTEEHRKSGVEASILVVRLDDTRRFGRVVMDEDAAVRRFEEKSDAPGAAWVNAGVYLMTRQRLLQIPDGVPSSFEREVLPSWVGCGLRAVRSSGGLMDIGTPESYEEARRIFGVEGPRIRVGGQPPLKNS
jgi:NDP-sugar pyrophosphorylase family protein